MSVRNPAIAFLGLIAACLITFTATAHAAAAVSPSDGTLLDYLTPVIQAFRDGSYIYAGSIALVVMVAVFRRYAPRYWPAAGGWSATDAGSAIITLVGAFGASMVAALATDHDAFTWALAWHSLEIAFGAAGGYTVIKHVIVEPYLLKCAGKGPAWLHYPMQMILWIFQETGKEPTPAERAVAGLHTIDRADIDVTVAVVSDTGTAIAHSPAAVAPLPVTVVTSTVAIQRTPTNP